MPLTSELLFFWSTVLNQPYFVPTECYNNNMAIVSSLTAIQADNNEYYELAYLIALNNVKKEDKQSL